MRDPSNVGLQSGSRLVFDDEPAAGTGNRTLAERGHALVRQGEREQAATVYKASLVEQPAQARVRFNLALIDHGGVEGNGNASLDAIIRLRQVLALDPGYGSAAAVLAEHLQDQEKPDAALTTARWALATGRASPEIHRILGTLEHDAGRQQISIDHYRHYLAAAPADVDTRSNLAGALLESGDVAAAKSETRRGRALDPLRESLSWTWSWILLLQGDLPRGFAQYGDHWSRPEGRSRQHGLPGRLWYGEALTGGTVLIWGEAGVGDEVLCAGMLDDALASGNALVVETDPRLVSLFRRSWPALDVVARTVPPNACLFGDRIQAQCSALRLPWLYRRRFDRFPARNGYLRADPDRVAACRRLFAALGPGMKVGLTWSSANIRTVTRKSIPLAAWQPVLQVPGAHFISLQYGSAANEVETLRAEGWPHLHTNPDPDPKDNLESLAAQIAALDLVVTISGVTAHLAGALGTPAIVLVPHAPLWFWFNQGERSPWYPSLFLVRQTRPGAWHQEIAQVGTYVEAWVAAGGVGDP